MSALKIRCATGIQGYNYVRKTCIPLPSYRTMCNRVVKLDMPPGIQILIMDWMEQKMQSLMPYEKTCCLSLDEVQLSPGVQYDHSLKRFVGYVSPELAPNMQESLIATHALCYMVKGVATRWKQLVGYFYTGTSIDGDQLWELTKDIICELGERGFFVTAVVSDMGSSNQAMWRSAGITTNRFSVECQVQHPYRETKNLYFMADVPHLLKNLRSAFLKHEILLPASIVQKYDLPSKIVNSSNVVAVVEAQEGKELKIAPKLTRKHVKPSQYEKMRVSMAAQVLSHGTATAIRTLVFSQQLPIEGLSTAFFCEFFNQWFDIMNCRCMKDALFSGSSLKITHLNEVLSLVKNFAVGSSACWKPVQAGIQLSTTSMLSLHAELVQNGALSFLMSARFTQDALENLFSQVRGFGNAHPKATQFRAYLKLICIGQFMDVPSKSSYDEDDTPHLLNFIRDHASQFPGIEASTEHSVAYDDMDVLAEAASTTLDICESNGLYYIIGYVLFKQLKKIKCDECTSVLTQLSSVDPAVVPESIHTLLKSYNRSKNLSIDEVTQHLCHPSKESLSYFKQVETIFRLHIESLHLVQNPVQEMLKKIVISQPHFPTCHNVLTKALKQFIQFRMIIHAKITSKTVAKKQFASRIAARAGIF